MNIFEIKDKLIDNNRINQRYELKVDYRKDIDKAQKFLLDNGFTWQSDTGWIDFSDKSIYGFVLYYNKRIKKHCILYNPTSRSHAKSKDHMLNFRDLISKDLLEENFISNLFKDII